MTQQPNTGVRWTTDDRVEGPSAHQPTSMSSGPSELGVGLAIVAALIFAFAGIQLIGIHSIAGDTIAEAFYNAVGMMSFGFAALSLAIGVRR